MTFNPMTFGFWNFSNHVYREENVATACLLLQNENNADVNMLLFCVWAAKARFELSTSTFEDALAFSRSWAVDIVRPLRAIRTARKREDEIEHRNTFRRNVKALELQAEKLQQEELQALLGANVRQTNSADSLRLAASNLSRYCAAELIDLNPENINRMLVILAAAFPATKSQVTGALFS